MTRKPTTVTECGVCHREIGVQADFVAVLRRGRRSSGKFRIYKHGHSATAPACAGSGEWIGPDQVYTKRYQTS